MHRGLAWVAGAHAAAALVHGVPHVRAAVWLTPWQSGFVAATVLGPFAAARVAGERQVRGGLAFSLLLAASVAFGVAHHWLLGGVDDVKNVAAPHHAPFEASAVALAVVGAAGVAAGLRVAYSRSAM